MALTAGTNLGPYEILGLIGAGGMGEVYRARDARLGREVAVKILPESFSGDAERLRRFEQEARAAGMLNHPGILTIYDVGTDQNCVYVVSELLAGETLREELGGVALPPRKAVEIALQIAHALAAAHEKGIVHRDLKPENIFLTKDGRVKILDFGLAKLIEPEPAPGSHSLLQTVDPGTQPGVVLGTVSYMSPEQVRGRAVDHRSDIFTFGAILYEMLTGVRAFHRDSAADTMSAILKEDPPDSSSTGRVLTPSLERVVQHCMEKKPEQRFQSARDLAFDLEMVSGITGGSAARAAVVPETRASDSLRKLFIALILIAALVSAFFLGRRTIVHPVQKEATTSESSIKRLTYRRGFISSARFTPDGQSVVYSASWVGDPEQVFVTRPQNPASRSLDLSGTVLLSISKTGEMALLLHPRILVGWQRIGTLARSPIDGGAPREIVRDVQDADWSPDGQSLAIAHAVDRKYRLEYPAGNVLYESEAWFNNIRISPKGDRIAFMDHATGGDDRGRVAFVDLKGSVKRLTPEYASASGLDWSPDGSEIWYTASTEGSNEQPLYAVDMEGNIRVVAAMVGNLILHDVYPDGTMLLARDSRRRETIVMPPGQTHERDFSWFDWTYARELSADGRTLLFEEQGAGGGPNYSVYIRNTDGSPAVKLGDGYALGMSGDSSLVAAQLPGNTQNFTVLRTGAGESKTYSVPGLVIDFNQFQWFRDNRRVLIRGHEQGGTPRWWVFDLQQGKATPIEPPCTSSAALLTKDETSILARSSDGFAFYSLQGGAPPRQVPGLDSGTPIQWTEDGRGVFVVESSTIPIRITRLDLASGQRTLWKELTPPDISGITGAVNVIMAPDGKTYAYTYKRVLSDLYRVQGLH